MNVQLLLSVNLLSNKDDKIRLQELNAFNSLIQHLVMDEIAGSAIHNTIYTIYRRQYQ